MTRACLLATVALAGCGRPLQTFTTAEVTVDSRTQKAALRLDHASPFDDCGPVDWVTARWNGVQMRLANQGGIARHVSLVCLGPSWELDARPPAAIDELELFDGASTVKISFSVPVATTAWQVPLSGIAAPGDSVSIVARSEPGSDNEDVFLPSGSVLQKVYGSSPFPTFVVDPKATPGVYELPINVATSVPATVCDGLEHCSVSATLEGGSLELTVQR